MIRARHMGMAARYLRHRWRALHPFEVQAVLLNACNLKCVYCRCPEMKTELLTTAQWLEIIRGLAALGTIRLKFQGGEPTLRPDFAALCAAARRRGIITAVTTNGTTIAERPELLDELDEAVLSLDAVSAERNDALRGANVHARVVHAIDLARARGVRVFVNMVVTRDTYDEVDAVLRFCEARGIGMHAQPVVFGRAPFDDAARDIALTAEQTRDLHRRLAEWKRQGRPLMFMARTYANVARWPDFEVLTTRSAGESQCAMGRDYVHIEPNGDVWPCYQHGAAFEPKNIVRDGLAAALRQARRHDCGDCFAAYLNERKSLFGLRPAALLELARRG